MDKKNEKKLIKIKEFLELANKHNINVNVDLSIYGNSSMKIIKEAKELFKGQLQKEEKKSEGSRWVIFHNASKGNDYLASDIKFNIFYPKK